MQTSYHSTEDVSNQCLSLTKKYPQWQGNLTCLTAICQDIHFQEVATVININAHIFLLSVNKCYIQSGLIWAFFVK